MNGPPPGFSSPYSPRTPRSPKPHRSPRFHKNHNINFVQDEMRDMRDLRDEVPPSPSEFSERSETATPAPSEIGYFTTRKLRKQTLLNIDHVVELQLVAAALNKLIDEGVTYTEKEIEELVTFFNGFPNLQVLTIDQNQEKAVAITRLITGEPRHREDETWIMIVEQRWKTLSQLLVGFQRFKEKMNLFFPPHPVERPSPLQSH
eukprot:TRINITY_DN12244_c0_g1::TRINITY_DN12244_c0_g1_i1::g.12970::m.12970 TRINITY_DN12244_c0_g1::TRINITY_DN12244_c0_g1_i1::g.12970  ORF type:complete len:204 (-),score=31.68 TRINITY_DN12244_c0_g1_i1:357-968(-)